MTITVVKPGPQTTIQASARTGQRHLGVPAGGAADPLSMALANRLVSNAWDAPVLEATLLGPTLRFESDCAFAIAGATASASLNGVLVEQHQTLLASQGDELITGAAETGARIYVAFGGGIVCEEILGSASTDLQAGFGGHEGRVLQAGDSLETGGADVEVLATPAEFRPPLSSSWGLRTCVAAETDLLNESSYELLFDTNWNIDSRADRMGLRLDGPALAVSSDGRMPSAGVIPGTIQCPEDGAPYILSVDAGTVGGYPRIAQVARVDRHVLGQLRPGDHVRLLHRDFEEATVELRSKIDYWRQWLPEIASILR